MVGQIGGVMLPEQQRAAEIQRQQTQTAGNMGGRFMTPEMIAAQQPQQQQQPTYAIAGASDYRPAGAAMPQQQPAQPIQQTQTPQPVDIAQVLAQGPIDPVTGQVRAFYDPAGQYQVVNGRLQSKLNL